MEEAGREVETAPGLTEAFMEYRARLKAFLRARFRSVADDSEVEDALQELWLRCRSVDPRNIADHKSYLFRIAHNLMIDRSRQIERGRRFEGDWSYVKERAGGTIEPSAVERSLIAREKLEKLNRALSQAGQRAAWIFHRHRIDGIGQQRIADELGISLSTVEKDIRKTYEVLSRFKAQSYED